MSSASPPDGTARAHRRAHVVLLVVAVFFVAAMLLLVAGPTVRPRVPEFPVGDGHAHPAGDTLVGPLTYTIDARSPGVWRFFRFAAGGVVDAPGPAGWDLAVRRHRLIVNGGAGFTGRGGILDLGAVRFDAVRQAPRNGYQATRVARDSSVAAAKWYDYGFLSHLLTSKGHVYAVRTAEGRYAKLEVLSYYCEGGAPGCFTIRYAYQGDGSRRLAR